MDRDIDDPVYYKTTTEISDDTLCGIGSFKPPWLQRFANKRAFMVTFSLLGVIQTMTWSYFAATISTLEKRFKLQSRTTGLVMTGNELSQITLSLFLAYYGGRGHRPRWIALGVACAGLSCILMGMPHIIYGPGEDALMLTKEYYTQELEINHISMKTKKEENLCRIGFENHNSAANEKECNQGDLSILPLVMIFLAQFIAGIGTTLYFSLGGPYMDDNMKKKQTPMMFGIMMAFRMIGPTFGYLMAFGLLKLYVSPSLTPLITNSDPRWLGAWWLGWIISGIAMIISASFMALFPRNLPKEGARVDIVVRKSDLLLPKKVEVEKIPMLQELSTTLVRLLKNKVLICDIMSSVCYIFGAIGYWTYKPKYLETVFHQTASFASFIAGSVGIFFMAAGLLISGVLITKFQPTARWLSGWNVVIGCCYIVMYISFTFIGCDAPAVHGSYSADGLLNLTAPCNSACSCAFTKFSPVCSADGLQTFYSPCHAGCQVSFDIAGKAKYTNCTCISADTSLTRAYEPTLLSTLNLPNTTSYGNSDYLAAMDGLCPVNCIAPLMIFMGIVVVIKLVDNTGRIGSVLVMYRCVDPKDKALAIGISIFAMSLLSMIPAPIFFGYLIDQACDVWGEKCGQRGNCWLYNSDKLRLYLNLGAACFTLLGIMFDVLVWTYVKDLDLYGDGTDEEQNNKDGKKKKKVLIPMD